MRKIILSSLCFLFSFCSIAQEFSRKDSLRGNLSLLRTCYDVTFYDLFVVVDEQELSLEQSYNIIHFTAINNFQKLQIDLAFNMEVQKVEFENNELEFSFDM